MKRTSLAYIIIVFVFSILITSCDENKVADNVFDTSAIDVSNVLDIGDVMDIVEWRNSIIVGGRDGVFLVDKGTLAIEKLVPENKITYVRGVLVDDAQSLWIASENGLWRVIEDEWQCFLPEDGSIPDKRVNAIYQDINKNLWVGTWGGIAIYDGGKWSHYGKEDGLITDTVNVITQSVDGVMWLGSYADRDGGVTHGTLGNWQIFGPDQGLVHVDVTSIISHDDKVYIGAGMYDRGGLNIMEKQEDNWMPGAVIDYSSKLLAGAKVRSLFCNGDYLWIGSEYDGLAVLNLTSMKSAILNEGLPHPEVKKMYLDVEGNLWIGTREGLLKLNVTDVTKIYEHLLKS